MLSLTSDVTYLAIRSRAFSRVDKKKYSPFWRGSVFENIKNTAAPRQRGKIGCEMAIEILQTMHGGLRIDESLSSDHDAIIAGGSRMHKVEVKLSTAWNETKDLFTWQQIRPMQDWDRLLLVGVNPNSLHLWWASKADVFRHIVGNDQYRQHGGQKGEQELYWINHHIPHWFRSLAGWND